MRIIFLNSWFGKVGKPYFDFIKKESLKTDIFCLLEVTPELYLKLKPILSGFNVLYEKGHNASPDNVLCGQTIFVSKKMQIVMGKKVSIYKQSDRDAGSMQFMEINTNGKKLFLGSVHGKTRPGTKLDTPIRIKQSQKIINLFSEIEDPIIIGGDFNLELKTKSVEMFEEAGYRNLIKDFSIKNTRNELSWKQFNSVQNFADYIFTSPEVKVKKFEVPYIEISDHLPLILEFEI
jgi:endonuclease/exonuclease/phosphatase (EEP) superfamily protein YafD